MKNYFLKLLLIKVYNITMTTIENKILIFQYLIFVLSLKLQVMTTKMVFDNHFHHFGVGV
jgi:hypothetical protein